MFPSILSNFLLRVYAQKLPLFHFLREKFSAPIRCGIFAPRVASSSATCVNFTFCPNFTLLQSLITHIIYVLCAWFARRRISLSWYVMIQLSTNVQQTMGIAALMPFALTMWAASRVPVCLDTPEMDSPVQVSHFALTFIHKLQCDQYKSDSLCVTVTMADHSHILTAHVCKRFRIFWCLFISGGSRNLEWGGGLRLSSLQPSSSFSLSLPSLFPSLPSLSLEVGPLNLVRAVNSRSRVCGSPSEIEFGAF